MAGWSAGPRWRRPWRWNPARGSSIGRPPSTSRIVRLPSDLSGCWARTPVRAMVGYRECTKWTLDVASIEDWKARLPCWHCSPWASAARRRPSFPSVTAARIAATPAMRVMRPRQLMPSTGPSSIWCPIPAQPAPRPSCPAAPRVAPSPATRSARPALATGAGESARTSWHRAARGSWPVARALARACFRRAVP
jgi:hypothetical protein